MTPCNIYLKRPLIIMRTHHMRRSWNQHRLYEREIFRRVSIQVCAVKWRKSGPTEPSERQKRPTRNQNVIVKSITSPFSVSLYSQNHSQLHFKCSFHGFISCIGIIQHIKRKQIPPCVLPHQDVTVPGYLSKNIKTLKVTNYILPVRQKGYFIVERIFSS